MLYKLDSITTMLNSFVTYLSFLYGLCHLLFSLTDNRVTLRTIYSMQYLDFHCQIRAAVSSHHRYRHIVKIYTTYFSKQK